MAARELPLGGLVVETGAGARGLPGAGLVIEAAAAGGATATTLSGPSTGTVGVASSSFIVGANGAITGTVTVTPGDGGAGGTFTPTSVAISSGTPTGTFTYTAASTGAKTISTTNNGGLTNPTSITFTAAAATTPPTLTSPTGTGGTLSCSGSVSTDEGNGTLYAVTTASATAPSAAQVKAGQDNTGAAALRVVSQAVSATGTQPIASGSVTAGTRYWHYMHEDAAGNQSAVVSSASFVVAAAGDTTSPVLTSPVGTQTGSTTATVGATTDEGNGTLYAVVTTSATQPSVAQIKAGQNNGGTSAAWAGSVAVSSAGAKTLSATGLAASTTYYAHLVHTDAAGNDSNRVVSSSFTTAAAATYGFDFDTAAGMVFGDLAGALTSLARQTGVGIVARAYSIATGALVATSATLTTNGAGRLPRWTDAALASATQYAITFTRQSDGEVCATRMTAT